MFEYFTEKLVALADSVLKPYWDRIMAASLRIRVAILLSFSGIGGVVVFPDVPNNFYVYSSGFIRVVIAESKQPPLLEILNQNLGSTVKRLSQTLKGDLLNLNAVSIVPWTAAQASAATANMEDVFLDRDAIVSFIRTNTVPGCACWSEFLSMSNLSVHLFLVG
jgi:hypothetical protein